MNELTQEEINFIIDAIQHSQTMQLASEMTFSLTNGHNWDEMAETVIEKIH